MPEITVPSSIKDLEQVQSVRTPIKMEYTFTLSWQPKPICVNSRTKEYSALFHP